LFFGNVGAYLELERRILSLDSYGGRLVPLIPGLWDGENHLVLERMPAPSILEYFSADLGLKLPQLHVSTSMDDVEPAMVELANSLDCTIDGLIVNESLNQLAEQSGNRISSSPTGYKLGNNKHSLHHYMVEKGLPVFDSYDAKNNDEVRAAAAKLLKQGYRHAVAKSAVGASGVGLVKFSTYRPEVIPDHMFETAPCLIQGWLDPSIPRIQEVCSPSVQFIIKEGVIDFYDLTDQLLGDDSVHEGNVSPPQSYTDPAITEEMYRQSEILAHWLHGNDFQGLGSVDFHLAFTDGGFEVRVCEINARVTGATYPSYLSKQFIPESTWLMQNLRKTEPVSCAEVIDSLDKNGFLYHRGMERGLIPINLNLTPEGLVSKGQYLFIGPDVDSVQDLSREFVENAGLIGARG